MPQAKGHHGNARPSRRRRKHAHHLIIARGDRIRSYAVRPFRIVLSGILSVAIVSGAVAFGFSYVLERQDAGATQAQNDIRNAYEIRIADMSQQIDTLNSQQIADRTSLEQQMDDLADRQDSLTERQQLLTGLSTQAIAAGIDVLPALAPLPRPNPARMGDVAATAGIDPVTTGTVATGTAAPQPVAAADVLTGEPLNAVATLSTMANAADVIEQDQNDAFEELAEAVETKTDALAAGLRALGYSAEPNDVGGPYVPVTIDHQNAQEVAEEIEELTDLQDYARSLPLGTPIATISVTSPFGVRRDPFLGTSAMHTGVDLVSASGTQVHATGPGRVITAAANGGYGNEVEIDHGNGIKTIYGHLSVILVHVGDVVAEGDVIGRSGSTGRSTGPHLHYEIRRNDTPIDPLPHLRASAALKALL